jgi:type I restriction enzyme M protein
MLTGTLKSKINKIWDTLYTAGITTPPTVMEQVTYLIFMKLLDDKEIIKESNASILGTEYESDVFKPGNYYPDEHSDRSIPYKDIRWSNFKNTDPTEMFVTVRDFEFPFIKTVNGSEKDTAFSRYMQDAVFLIPNAQVLALCVDELDGIDMTDADVMGDVYEEFLGKMAASGNNGQFRTPRHIILISRPISITTPY